MFLAHLLGLDMTSRMQGFFSALLRDDYNLAALELLSHSASLYLGAVMQMLARRIRDASIDYQDMFIASVQPAKFLLHRKKAKSYILRYYIPKKNESGQSHIFKQTLSAAQRTESGACYA